MKPVFFPHTLIEPALARALNACLGPVALFHPLAEAAGQLAALKQAQQIELVVPCPDQADMLMATYEGFKNWASEHAGQDLARLLQQSPAIPFFDANATAQIAAEIKSADMAPVETTAEDRLQRARLLLLMAQELDVNRRELETAFQRMAVQERRMLALLRGEAQVDDAACAENGGLSPETDSAALHGATARIAAWARLALAVPAFWKEHTAILFLTASREVLDHVRDQVEAEDLLKEHIEAPGSDELYAWLAAPQGQPPATAAPTTDATPASFTLSVIRVPGLAPHQWLRLLAGEGAAAPGEQPQRAPTSGFLVGHVKLI